MNIYLFVYIIDSRTGCKIKETGYTYNSSPPNLDGVSQLLGMSHSSFDTPYLHSSWSRRHLSPVLPFGVFEGRGETDGGRFVP